MNSARIPQAVENIHAFMQELLKLNSNKTPPELAQLIQDWAEIKAFTDAVFYPVEILTHAQKREQIETEAEAEEEVDILLFELGINVQE